jgi:hypothetical protein
MRGKAKGQDIMSSDWSVGTTERQNKNMHW